MQRTQYCGSVTAGDIGRQVRLCGWVSSWRDHGGVVFIDLRDIEGVVQVVFSPEAKSMFESASRLRSEYVIAVSGTVRARPAGAENPQIPSGMVEVAADELVVLNTSLALPFEFDQADKVAEDVRLRWRFLDLRRPALQKNLVLRHRVTQSMRTYLSEHRFLELETPFLTKSTPEGARDFLVPSRLNAGHFFALPQSPQLFKQLLMVAGYDRYFQIARCFRDEDLRADRQPEFTQVDLEMSFIDESDIYAVIEPLLAHLFKAYVGVEIPQPFKRLAYADAMARYGSDKPDLRFELEIVDVSQGLTQTQFKVFAQTIARGDVVRGIRAPGGERLSRMDIENLTAFVGQYGAKGLAWLKHTEHGLESSIGKFFTPGELSYVMNTVGSRPGDLLLFVADSAAVAAASLGALRLELIKRLSIAPLRPWDFSWVVDFPLFEWSAQENRLVAMHHPFTAPRAQDVETLKALAATTDSAEQRRIAAGIYARAYDIVLNGVELGGGSIRIHDRAVQALLFEVLRFTEEQAHERFGFLLEALQYGAPPHGGIALGLDRLIALMAGEDSIRDTIPFPKTQKAACLLTGAPDTVSPKQLAELHIKLK